MKNPDGSDSSTILELREYAVRYGDQAIQLAAIQGLEKIGGKDAVMTLTERMLDSWGLTGIGGAIKALTNLAEDGGLLPLTATLSYDYRFWNEKLLALRAATKRMKLPQLSKRLEKIYERNGRIYSPSAAYEFGDTLRSALTKLESVPFDDIKYGAVIAKTINPLPSRSTRLKLPEPTQIGNQAIGYAETRLPGLVHMLQKNPSKMWKF